MQLNDLIGAVEATTYNYRELDIVSLEFDSRKVSTGALFIALPGGKHDGHDYVHEALKRGARAVVVQQKLDLNITQIIVPDCRAAMAKLAKRFYGDFSDMIKIGITGTNGKTTTAFILYRVLKAAGYDPALIGTIYYIGREKIKAERTTPESLDIFKNLKKFHDDGCRSLVMEVSSHALSLNRVDELEFDIACFTNFSQDHLDFHKSLKRYKQAKLRIFTFLKPEGYAVYNLDDVLARDISALNMTNRVSYGLKEDSDIKIRIEHDDINGIDLDIQYRGEHCRIHSNLIGDYNACNVGAAYACAVALGIEPASTIKSGIESVKSVRGRMERVINNIFVDYAHTPDALEKALITLSRYKTGQLIVVFGCGGDRDRGKRPLMGMIADRHADRIFVTSDNPRGEDPGAIIKEIIGGIKDRKYTIIENRKDAIHQALNEMTSEDILLVAGKGHEDYQIIGDRVIDFDDAEVIREWLKRS